MTNGTSDNQLFKDGYLEQAFDLNFELIKNPSSTFYARVSGRSMKDAGVDEGDLLVIDKSLDYKRGAMAVCFVDGGFTLKFLERRKDGLYLIPANPDYKPIKVNDEDDGFTVWGIVTNIVKKVY
jgi:SOS-response transcriptional repressors (RecA-mediated autopeptidases)